MRGLTEANISQKGRLAQKVKSQRPSSQKPEAHSLNNVSHRRQGLADAKGSQIERRQGFTEAKVSQKARTYRWQGFTGGKVLHMKESRVTEGRVSYFQQRQGLT